MKQKMHIRKGGRHYTEPPKKPKKEQKSSDNQEAVSDGKADQE